jgi:uncharacterized membrane protein YdbT with pleckstrin-like domain
MQDDYSVVTKLGKIYRLLVLFQIVYISYIVRFKYIVLRFGGHTYSSTGQTLHLQRHRIGATQLVSTYLVPSGGRSPCTP